MVGETSEPGDSAESEFERVTRETKEAWRAADGDPCRTKAAELEWMATTTEAHEAWLQQEGRTTASEVLHDEKQRASS